jgi:hypothetical protein
VESKVGREHTPVGRELGEDVPGHSPVQAQGVHEDERRVAPSEANDRCLVVAEEYRMAPILAALRQQAEELATSRSPHPLLAAPPRM